MGAHVRKLVGTFALSAALAVCCVSAAYAADDAGAVPKDSAVKVQSGVGDGSAGSAAVQDSVASRTGASSSEASKKPQPVRYKQGWNLIDGDWYYAVSETKLKTGWLRTGGSWYYLEPGSGKMATGLKKVGGATYHLASSGAMTTGWALDGGKWYWSDSSGALKTGWRKLGGSWYWLDKSTFQMATGWQQVDGKWYYLRSNGAMATGWLKDDNSWYYLDSNNGGRMVASKWQYVGSVDYKFNGSGRMVGAWVNVPAMNQYPNLPDGCESVALANMLRYYGFPTSNTTIWNSYLSFSDWNFVSAYAMGGCMAPAIRDAANRYLSARGSSLRAQDVTGSSRSDIYWYLQYGIPVQVWGTVNNGGAGYAKASQWYGGRLYNFYTGNHSIVVQGYDEERGIVYVADSISGSVARSASSFFNNYWTTGAQAVVIR